MSLNSKKNKKSCRKSKVTAADYLAQLRITRAHRNNARSKITVLRGEIRDGARMWWEQGRKRTTPSSFIA